MASPPDGDGSSPGLSRAAQRARQEALASTTRASATRPERAQPRTVGRYEIHDRIASGGMASVYFGHARGRGIFSGPVAIKQLHPHLARDPQLASMFLDEARIASRIRHANVAVPLDVLVDGEDGAIFLVLEYIHGETLSRLRRNASRTGLATPPAIPAAIVAGALRGLHAAHEARDEHGAPLGVVHCDISPQNIMVGVDGAPRILDFGIARTARHAGPARSGAVSGKVSYMAPEQIQTPATIDRRVDVFAAGVVLWEALTGCPLFAGINAPSIIRSVLRSEIPAASRSNPAVPVALDRVLARALERDPEARFPDALQFAEAIEQACPVATPSEVGAWVAKAGAKVLAARLEVLWRLDTKTDPPAVERTRGRLFEGTPVTAALRREPARPPAAPAGGVHDSDGAGLTRGELVTAASTTRGSRRMLAVAALAAAIVGVASWSTWRLGLSRPARTATSSAPLVAHDAPTGPIIVAISPTPEPTLEPNVAPNSGGPMIVAIPRPAESAGQGRPAEDQTGTTPAADSPPPVAAPAATTVKVRRQRHRTRRSPPANESVVASATHQRGNPDLRR